VFAGAAGADEAVLRAFIALDLGVLERRPIRLFVFEAADIFFMISSSGTPSSSLGRGWRATLMSLTPCSLLPESGAIER